MPFIEVNEARLYYETFGTPAAGKAPVVLIHGSTGTGQSNWREAAPLLAREWYVIVPDCRGHGQSENPQQSYSFKEMADDTAALVRALGFERAHIIGHSNGGNVALVTLVEHPEVTQTAVLQAANAWVSPDLVEKEPPIFEPERVKRESPGWMNEMIELHSATHGPEYWRSLLQMTLKELISEPNYTPEDLNKVERPALVVQGELDRVNAPYKHAQFIAQHIPEAELWIPLGVGHTVHEERLFEWVEKVAEFLRRRGDDANEALYRLRQSQFRDGRITIQEVRAEPAEGSEALKLSGRTLTDAGRKAALELFGSRVVEDKISVLIDESTPWGLVTRAVTDLRAGQSRRTERFSQILVGEAVRVIEVDDKWAYVRAESDGYLGWVRASAIHPATGEEVQAWKDSCTHLVSGLTPTAWERPEAGAPLAGQLVFGAALPVIDQREGRAAVRLPNGECWWLEAEALLPLAERPQPDLDGLEKAIEMIKRFSGVPYLWGGRTPFGIDCSGLNQTFWSILGVQLPRDADQQYLVGKLVEAESPQDYQPGDLLFFFKDEDDLIKEPYGLERHMQIDHVALSLGGTELIQASGSQDRVAFNSLDPESPRYSDYLVKHLYGVRRNV